MSSRIRRVPHGKRQIKSMNDENSAKEEALLQKRRQRRRRRRPISNSNQKHDSLPQIPPSPSKKKEPPPSSFICRIDDPFHLISMAVEHDESRKNALEMLQIPLETGKLYHNEKLFLRALYYIRKETRSFRWGWLMPFKPSLSWKEYSDFNERNNVTKASVNEKHRQHEGSLESTVRRQNPLRSDALTPIILSGLLACLDNSCFPPQEQFLCSTTTEKQFSIEVTFATNSAELVNYAIGMRRAAQARVRLKAKRDRVQRIVNPFLVITTLVCFYFYAWSSLQRLLVGFYGVTDVVFAPPKNANESTTEIRVKVPRLITSSCRSKFNADHYGSLSDYSKACRSTEATTFESLTSSHNSHHTKLFARTAYDEIGVESGCNADNLFESHEICVEAAAALMQLDDTYADDTELPLYTMHTVLVDIESSIIPLDDIIHGQQQEKGELQRPRWRRRRRLQQKTKHKRYQNTENTCNNNIATTFTKLSHAVQFWGDTTVNHLVREAIVEAHYKDYSTLSSTKSIKKENELKLLDVGSGLAGTLFSLCTPEFPFENWSYHGIAISQPEVRRAKQLINTVVRPIISSASKMASSSTNDSGDCIVDSHVGVSIDSNSFPLSNITIEQTSFDNPLPPKEYTTMVAIESLAFSRNITMTLMNLARSLESKGTLIIIEDVVLPWAKSTSNNSRRNFSDHDIQEIAKLSGKSSLLTHDKWLESFQKAGLQLLRPPRDLMLEFDAWSVKTHRSALFNVIALLPFLSRLTMEIPWYSIGYHVLKKLVDWFGNINDDGSIKKDDGHLLNRALFLMTDLMENANSNVHRKAAFHNADLGYYMYVCTKI